MNILLLLGTGREGRESQKAALFLSKRLKDAGFMVDYVDIKDHLKTATIASWQESDQTVFWKNKVKDCDALVIVTPEYNHGYPGELKILLDSAFAEYFQKPVAICGVSSGGFGGVRAVEQLRQVFLALGAIVINSKLHFSNIVNLFDDNLQPNDQFPADSVEKFVSLLNKYFKK